MKKASAEHNCKPTQCPRLSGSWWLWWLPRKMRIKERRICLVRLNDEKRRIRLNFWTTVKRWKSSEAISFQILPGQTIQMGLKVIKIQEGGATVRPLHNLTKIKNFSVVFDQTNFSFFLRRRWAEICSWQN